jgi:hypothetical protein
MVEQVAWMLRPAVTFAIGGSCGGREALGSRTDRYCDGPHITNQLIRKALAPYRDDLVIVTKVGARRGTDGSWLRASSPEELTQTVHDNLRSMLGVHGPAEGSLETPVSVLAGEHTNA